MSSLSSFRKFRLSANDNPFSKLLPVIFVFVLSAVFVPVVGPIILFLLPMILFLNGTFNGTFKTSAVFFISYSFLLCIAVLFSLDIPAIAVFAMGVAGILMAQIAGKNYSIEKTIIYPALFIVGAISFYFIYDALALSVNPWQLVKNYITLLVKENINLYSKLPLQAEDINLIKDNERSIINGLIQVFPSVVIILSLSIIWVNLLIGKNYLGRAGIIYPKFTALARWKMPEGVIWIFIVSGVLFFVPERNINFYSFNVFLVVCFFYLLQGLAIVSFFFQIKNVPVFLRYLFYFFIAVQQFLMIPIIATGLFDIWIDFRKFFQKDRTAV